MPKVTFLGTRQLSQVGILKVLTVDGWKVLELGVPIEVSSKAADEICALPAAICVRDAEPKPEPKPTVEPEKPKEKKPKEIKKEGGE